MDFAPMGGWPGLGWANLMMVLVILTDLALLSSSRLAYCVRLAGMQGVGLSLVPLLMAQGSLDRLFVLFCLVALAVKGIIFPWFLNRTLRRVQVRHEIEPYLGYQLSLLLGIVGLVLSLGLESRLGQAFPRGLGLSFAVGFTTILTGLTLMVTRRKAVTQVIGYLVAENGIFLLGTTLVPHGSLLVEMCILLDVFVAVFVMGIAIHHISREFHSIDTNLFCSIRD
jgi:hydrogenase-4 component E